VRDALAEHGVASVPAATGSKGYHIVSPIRPTASTDAIGVTLQKFAALLAAKYPDELTTVFRIALRGGRVFVDWLRNNPIATVVVPYSLRARPRATVATPLTWVEIESTDPDAFTIADTEGLLERQDPLADLAAAPSDTAPFIAAVDEAFEKSGLVLETFDRFRS
jgi:bifunctional non-homologous end joining protein LigD